MKNKEIQDEDKLVALHNISGGNILNIDELGGMVTPSIAIIKAGESYTDFGEITLIADKNLINPEKQNVRVFAGDVYSPTVPRKKYYVDSKKLEKKEIEIINKSFDLDKERNGYHFVSNVIGQGTRLQRDLENNDKESFFKSYYDNLKVVYLIDKNIEFKIPVKNRAVYIFNNFLVDLTEKEKKQLIPILEDYRKETELGSGNLTELTQKHIYDFLVSHINSYRDKKIKELKESNKDATKEDIDYLYSLYNRLIENRLGSNYKEMGMIDSTITKLWDAIYVKKVLDEDAFKKIINAKIKSLGKENYDKWLNEFIDTYQGEAYFEKGNKKIPFTLDNLVNETSKSVVGVEDNLTYGINKAKSFSHKELKTIKDIKSKTDSLISKKEMSEIDENIKEEFFKIVDKFNYKYDSQWDKLDSFSKSFAMYFKGSSIDSALIRNDFKKPTSSQVEIFKNFANKLKQTPVDYFEVKIGRAVKLSEFKYAVVPSNLENQVINVLKKNGLKVVKYNSRDSESRMNAVNSILNKDKNITFENGGEIKNQGLFSQIWEWFGIKF